MILVDARKGGAAADQAARLHLFAPSGITPVGVLITSGFTETRGGQFCGVPKLNLVSRLQALFHEGKLKIQDFRCEYTAAGHLTFNARSGKHDDLVLALAIAVWRPATAGWPVPDFSNIIDGSRAIPRRVMSLASTWANPEIRLRLPSLGALSTS